MFEKFLEDFRSQRMFPKIGTIGGPGGRLFLFWRSRRSAWRDALTQTMVRKKRLSSMVIIISKRW